MNRFVYKTLGGVIRAFRNPAYKIYTSGNFVSLVGTWVQRVATGWLAWELTGSGFWLGLIAAADLLPSVIMGPLGGAAADRLDRYRLMIVSQILLTIQAFALGFLTLVDWMTPVILLLLTLAHGFIVSFGQPARLAAVRSLVRSTDLPAAIAVNSILWNGARFVGPAISGVVIVGFGVGWAFVVNGVSYLAFIYALAKVKDAFPSSGPKHTQSILQEIGEGFAYATRHQGIGPLLALLILGSIFARPFAELLPGFADAVFSRGAEGLAILTSATGIGAMIGGIWMSRLTQFDDQLGLALRSNAMLAVGLGILCATDWFWVGVIGTTLAGYALVVNGVATQSMVQLACAPAMLGRVLSIYGLSMRAGPAIGSLAMGAASDYLGLPTPVLVGAAICVVAWLWTERSRSRIDAALRGSASA